MDVPAIMSDCYFFTFCWYLLVDCLMFDTKTLTYCPFKVSANKGQSLRHWLFPGTTLYKPILSVHFISASKPVVADEAWTHSIYQIKREFCCECMSKLWQTLQEFSYLSYLFHPTALCLSRHPPPPPLYSVMPVCFLLLYREDQAYPVQGFLILTFPSTSSMQWECNTSDFTEFSLCQNQLVANYSRPGPIVINFSTCAASPPWTSEC